MKKIVFIENQQKTRLFEEASKKRSKHEFGLNLCEALEID